MNCYGWLMAIKHFSTIYGSTRLNNHILFSDIHYFEALSCPNVFVDIGDSVNGQKKYNGPNVKLKYLCNKSQVNRNQRFSNLKFRPYHMNFILVYAWGEFKLLSCDIIWDSFSKKNIFPLAPVENSKKRDCKFNP